MSVLKNQLMSFNCRRTSICPECGTQFVTFRANTPTHRACDAQVCSKECGALRAKYIAKMDPGLTNPETWHQQRYGSLPRSTSSSRVTYAPTPPPMPTWREVPENDEEHLLDHMTVHDTNRCGDGFRTAFTVSAVCLTALMVGLGLVA